MRKFLRFMILPLLLATTGIQAAERMKPGLWEMTMRSDAMKAMPKIPPEQMEKMQQMGIKMPMMQNGAMVHKICITREMAERDQPPADGREQQMCQNKNFSRSGNTYTAEIVCDGPDMKGNGNVKGSYSGNTMSSVYDFKGTSRGQPVSQHMETSGKWLSADCGNVRPAGEMMPKK